MKEASRLAHKYVMTSVGMCQSIIDQAVPDAKIDFDWNPADDGTHSGDPDEPVDAKWWTRFLSQAIAESSMKGPGPTPKHGLFKGVSCEYYRFVFGSNEN